ncbi:MAG: nucleoside triphosphate pyrophosphohydrolase [Bacteroidales bacterium]|nr:nucleoside triphosphate pyrophosphohydrolase [Bacteroidales bacterium]
MNSKQEKLDKISRLLDVMDRLREECPWNGAQTTESIRPMTVEEVYELRDAIIKGDQEEIKTELGDRLYPIVFYARIASETDKFDIGDVAQKITDKMVFRHPHVFGDGPKPQTADDIANTWELVKAKEKGGNKRIMSGIPNSMPSMLKAISVQEKARGTGFDWEDKHDVWDKVKEEMGEYQRELDAMDAAGSEEERAEAISRAEGELGDFIFSTINAARLYGLDPDKALNRTCNKFMSRFTYLEEKTIRQGRNLKDMTLAEMDEIWDEAKKKGL